MTKRVFSGVRRIPTVLLVDDRRTNLLALKLILEPKGYRLLTASSGAAALGACRTERVDLVVLDVLMPGLDGIEVAERMRAAAATKAIPIVFATAVPEEVARFSERDRDDVSVIAKPIDAELLGSTVERLLAAYDVATHASAR